MVEQSVVSVSVVVPVFNSYDTLGDLVDEIARSLDGVVDEYEVVLVDDGSSDGSWHVIESLGERVSQVRGIRLARNFGEQNAVLCGVRSARHEVVVTIDDDLQQPPSEIPTLLGALVPGVDLVYGVAERYQHGVGRRTATALTKWTLEHVFRVPRATGVTSFRAFRTDLRRAVEGSPGPMFSIDGFLMSTTTRVAEVVVRHDPRRSGRTRYSLAMFISHTMNMITGSAVSPLLFAWVLGAVCVLSGASGVVAVLVMAAVRTGPIALDWLLVWIAIGLVGAVLAALALLGEYAARILGQLSGRPAYLLHEVSREDG